MPTHPRNAAGPIASSAAVDQVRPNSEGKMIRAIQCGVISDVIALAPDAAPESTLSAMLAKGGDGLNPLELTGEIVRFYVERWRDGQS